MRRLRRFSLGLALAGIAAACGPGTSQGPSARPQVELTVYGAASLAKVLEHVRTAYAAAAPGTTLIVSTDSSAALEAKIEQGAPADVFLSADTVNPRRLADAGLTDGDPVPFAGNALTVITPRDNPAKLARPFDLARAGIRIVAAGEEVPITRYATQVVANLAAQPGAPPGFAAAYAANIVSREDNVGAVRAKIELGEGDAAIVYLTDAAASTMVKTLAVPEAANVPATYAGVVVGSSGHAAEARAFLGWLTGPGGQAVLAEFGFLPLPR